MADLFDYIKWRGDICFSASPFNPVDNIILSQLSYLTLDGIVPSPEDKTGISIALAVRVYNERLNSREGIKVTSIFKEDPQLISSLASSRRFGDCQLFGYVNQIDTNLEIQFSALSVNTNDGFCFIAFRGTDTSLVGWKEDFNMCFKDVVPSQLEAVKYLDKMAPMIKEDLRVGGHSKGGNLAIYSASNCSKKNQKRIKVIYNNDAPGFNEKFISSTGYLAVKDRIQSYVPQSSVIGMFMEHGKSNIIIKSTESGIMQHCLYSWEVTHNDLVRAEKSTVSSRFINKTIREWINSHDNAQREHFIEALYHIFNEADVKSTVDFENSWFSSAGRVLKSLSHVDESTRKFIRKTIAGLFVTAGRNFDSLFKNDE
ncbi:MAG: DUF2974 domain-containing protein [Treponema sp.]|nr:DUF2974 domain-containing protein [Treponema sp.]